MTTVKFNLKHVGNIISTQDITFKYFALNHFNLTRLCLRDCVNRHEIALRPLHSYRSCAYGTVSYHDSALKSFRPYMPRVCGTVNCHDFALTGLVLKVL